MEAKELMIGNYVKDPYGKTIKLVSVGKDASMLKPIPLTEDWLLKFGFDRTKVARMHKIFKYSLNSVDIYYREKDNRYTLWFNKYVPLDFVHQMQNLYFALTGEELKRTTPSKTLEQ